MELSPSSRGQETVRRTVSFDLSSHSIFPYKKETIPNGMVLFYGASDVTRTRDLLITSEMHYRLCYTSNISLNIISVI